MKKNKQLLLDIVLHCAFAVVFCLVLPLLSEFSTVANRFSNVMAQLFGQGSKHLPSINVFVAIASIGVLIYYRLQYKKKVLRYALLIWAFLIPNQLLTSAGWINIIDSLSVNLNANLTLLPFICLSIGIIIATISIIRELLLDYLERTRDEREQEKKERLEIRNKRKELSVERKRKTFKDVKSRLDIIKANVRSGLNSILIFSSCVVIIILFAILLYAIHTHNILAIVIISVIIAIMLITGFVFLIAKIIGKKRNPASSGGASSSEFWIGLTFGVIQLLLLSFVILGLFALSSGTFNFSRIIESFKSRPEAEPNLWSYLTSLGFIADFVTLSFIIFGLVFAGLLIYFMFADMLEWATMGKIIVKYKQSDDQIPPFFRKTHEITSTLMEYIADSVLSIIKFARFIPNFFTQMHPVVFDQNADEEYELVGKVIDSCSKTPISDVIISRTVTIEERTALEKLIDKITKNDNPSFFTEKLAITDYGGCYTIEQLHISTTTISFSKDGYQSKSLLLDKDTICDIELTPYFKVNGRVLDNNDSPINGAKIKLKYNSTNLEIRPIFSDDNGCFAFKKLTCFPDEISVTNPTNPSNPRRISINEIPNDENGLLIKV